ncbi:hypothetical protein PV326_004460 [Microctonus aethiopoides]|nr:hypothetical protein PV326_004460 [Microctonus aethiopoides]
MPAASSIYWNSVDSQRSSVGSSGDTGSARQYVDPWDLENYAYLRRHSVATPLPNYNPPLVSAPPRKSYSRASQHRYSVPELDYWYSQREPIREPGYHAPASVDELYFGSSRQTIHSPNYQAIYEDEMAKYSTPVYAPLSAPILAKKNYYTPI